MIQLTPEQLSIVDVFENTERNILIHGPGGVGKSECIKYIYEKHNELLDCGYHSIYKCALTGIAGHNIGGSTFHRLFGILLPRGNYTHNTIIDNIKRSKSISKIKNLKCVIIDEISMMGAKLFDAVNKAVQFYRRNDLPFGGIRLIISGDFLQLPPINDDWVFKSKVWNELNLHKFNMEKLMRYKDEMYGEMLMRIRKGLHTKDDCIILNDRVMSIQDVNALNIQTMCGGAHSSIIPTKFYSHNLNVDEVNDSELKALKTTLYIIPSIDTIKKGTARVCHKIADEIFTSTVNLKIGAQVMLRANLDVDNGLCNGSRGVVMDILGNVNDIDVMVLVKFMNGSEIFINRHEFEYEDDDVKFIRSQIPLSLAWAMTIHKCVSGDTKLFIQSRNDITITEISKLFPLAIPLMIEMHGGWLDIGEETKVMSGNGKFYPINKLYYGVKSHILEFVTQNGYAIKCSKNHMLLVSTTGGDKPGIEWKYAPDIKLGDKVCIRNSDVINTHHNIISDNTNRECEKITLDGTTYNIDDNFVKTISYFWALNYRCKGNVVFISSNDKYHSREYNNNYCPDAIIIDIYNFCIKYNINQVVSKYGIIISSLKFVNLLNNIIGHNNPSIPYFVKNKHIFTFFNSIVDMVGKNHFMSSNIIKARNFQLLGLMCGFNSQINTKNIKGFETIYLVEIIDDYNKIVYDSVVSKKWSNDLHQTYDIEVDEVHNFIGNGIINHNSQSCSLDYAIGDLGDRVFASGQSYVMLSRIRTLDGLKLESFTPKSIKVDAQALSYVYSLDMEEEISFSSDEE